MSIAIVDYGSGNLRSAAKALETASSNINSSYKIVVTADPKIIKQSDKVILPGQGSFRDCYYGIKKIQFQNINFRNSDFIRLNVLRKFMKKI